MNNAMLEGGLVYRTSFEAFGSSQSIDTRVRTVTREHPFQVGLLQSIWHAVPCDMVGSSHTHPDELLKPMGHRHGSLGGVFLLHAPLSRDMGL